MIRLDDISLYFYGSGRMVLDGITWTIGERERWVLYGKNGSGKTRLLEVVAGYQFPSRGEVRRFGRSSTGCDVRDMRRRIGYVGTPLAELFNGNESLRDVVISGLYASIGLFREPGGGEVRRAHDLMDAIGLGDRGSDRFGVLSDGERQKLLMARALIGRPDILLLDEPARGLDLPSREDLLDTLSFLAKENGLALVYVTHHTEEITPLFEKLFIIERGRCFYSGAVEEGFTSGNLGKLFGRGVVVEKRGGRYYTILKDVAW